MGEGRKEYEACTGNRDLLLFVPTQLYILRSRSLSRAALCSGSGTPTSLPFTRPHWQSLPAGNIFQSFVDFFFSLLQLLGFGKFNVMLNKAPLDLSCHSTDVSWEFQPIKITLSRTRYFYSNFRCRLLQQSSLLLHRSLENLVFSRSFGHRDMIWSVLLKKKACQYQKMHWGQLILGQQK